VETYSERIALRNRLWWDRPRPTELRACREAIHRLRERRAFRSRDDPDEAWRCCEFWPRTLLNKWNAREFAAKHGCSLPELYWRGSDRSKAPIESLPSQFVVRPVFGSGRRGVLVVAEGRELLRDEPASRSEIRDKLPRSGPLQRRLPFLLEEFVRSEDGRHVLPIEYKCHTFRDTVAAVQVTERISPKIGKHRFYTAAWEPFSDPMNVDIPPNEELMGPPGCLDQIQALAVKLGSELGTYARIDFFATDRGCVFCEFSSIPEGGHGFTPYCDELFGALWAEKFPDAT
jgi:hypothetical protein